MEECHLLLTDQIDLMNPEGNWVMHDISKPLPLGGPPGQVTIQPQYFFNKDLEYLVSGNKERKHALSISKLKAAYYPDFGLEELVPSLWTESESAYDISLAYGISHWWFKRKESHYKTQCPFRSQCSQIIYEDSYSLNCPCWWGFVMLAIRVVPVLAPCRFGAACVCLPGCAAPICSCICLGLVLLVRLCCAFLGMGVLLALVCLQSLLAQSLGLLCGCSVCCLWVFACQLCCFVAVAVRLAHCLMSAWSAVWLAWFIWLGCFALPPVSLVLMFCLCCVYCVVRLFCLCGFAFGLYCLSLLAGCLVEYGVSTSIGYGVSSSLSNTSYSSQQINTAYPLPSDTAYRSSGTETENN
ncbi:hypothetical protein Tco_0604664 [Tanacetum coccineum]